MSCRFSRSSGFRSWVNGECEKCGEPREPTLTEKMREEWPGYEVTFRDGGRHRGVGITVGILIGR